MRAALVCAACVCLAAVIGCGGGDPEAGSGGDAYRNEAQDMPLDELVDDSLSLDEADRTDWKALEIEDGGQLAVEFLADEAETKTFLAVFDRYGTQLGAAQRSGGQVSTLSVDVPRGGRYFLVVQALEGPPTAYSVMVSLGAAPGQGGSPTGRPGF
ncbi:MAG: hypothetical protein QF464_05755 [Myxococcota bacterium]|nr:hypothetical protein [Myxococcota bacterium]